ncbi:TPA: TonB-dependent siderophore receptor [Pseudomonas aeruginosa]
MTPFPRFALRTLPALFLSLGCLAATVQAAEAVRYRFSQAAAPLAQALNAFSRASGQTLLYTAELPPQATAPALHGSLDAEEALQRLLQGSGLRARRIDERTLTLEPIPASGALDLDATTVSAAAPAQGYRPAANASISRGDAPLLEIPQAISVVPAQALQDQRPRNLDDALGNISGITQANTLGGTQDAVMKRGFGDNRDGSIMRDGMPSVQGRNFTATAGHVEVLKGPASLLYGIQDPGGVVNVVSKKPQLQQANALTLRGSAYAHGRNGSGGQLDSTGPLGDSGLAYRMILDHEDEDYWRDFGKSRETLVAPSLAWYGEDTTVNLSYEHREFTTPFDRGTAIDPRTNRPLDIPRSRRLDEPFNITEGRSELTRLDLERQLDDTWKAHFGYGYSRETYDDNQARVMAVNADGTLTRRMDGTHGAVSSDSFATLGLSGTLQLAGLQHDLQFGMDHEKRKIFRADLLRDSKTSRFDYLDPAYGQVVPSTRVVAGDSDQTDKLRSDSLYFQDSIHLDERWILVGGARYQIYDQLAGRGRPFNANTDINGQKWVPRGGLVYRLSDEVSLYGSYTRSFKPNSTIAPLSTGETIDSAILPEEATSWELGAKLDVPGRLSGTLALFDIRKKNVLVNELDGAGNSSVRAAGRVRSRGLELDLTGQLSERWSLIGSYAWLAAEVTEDPTLEGKRLQNVARNTASLSAVYELGQLFGGDRLRLGGGARYVGKRPGDPANSFDLPSYTVADAFASYDTRFGGHGVKFQLNVKNLFDRTYYPSSANRLYVAMGEPRQFQLSTTVEF